mmetsp:Transcript_22353/g.66837  ORF Transcript_22353/g.66837 Transcript_22353/m.66837 type:complete len:379 (+) Transcript_22353:400-1536(+)
MSKAHTSLRASHNRHAPSAWPAITEWPPTLARAEPPLGHSRSSLTRSWSQNLTTPSLAHVAYVACESKTAPPIRAFFWCECCSDRRRLPLISQSWTDVFFEAHSIRSCFTSTVAQDSLLSVVSLRDGVGVVVTCQTTMEPSSPPETACFPSRHTSTAATAWARRTTHRAFDGTASTTDHSFSFFRSRSLRNRSTTSVIALSSPFFLSLSEMTLCMSESCSCFLSLDSSSWRLALDRSALNFETASSRSLRNLSESRRSVSSLRSRSWSASAKATRSLSNARAASCAALRSRWSDAFCCSRRRAAVCAARAVIVSSASLLKVDNAAACRAMVSSCSKIRSFRALFSWMMALNRSTSASCWARARRTDSKCAAIFFGLAA